MSTVAQSKAEPLPPLIRWKFAWIFVAGIALVYATVGYGRLCIRSVSRAEAFGYAVTW
jgi:hypothetical protein